MVIDMSIFVSIPTNLLFNFTTTTKSYKFNERHTHLAKITST